MAFYFEILDVSFDPSKRLAQFARTNINAGAITSFLGQVRGTNTNNGKPNTVTELFLQSYPGVTEKGIAKAMSTAQSRWAVSDILIVHRIGALHAGEPIVLVGTAAPHRRAAFEACDYLMDYLKTEAVFWKRETSGNGTAWIEPRSQDYQDNKRWNQA